MHLQPFRYTSASRDAHKMYGDITPGDQSHQEVILLYQNHFKSVFHNMAKEFLIKMNLRSGRCVLT